MQHVGHCHSKKGRPDYLLWGSLVVILFAFLWVFVLPGPPVVEFASVVSSGAHTIVDLMNKMAWGLVLAIFFVGLMDIIPRSRFHKIFGNSQGLQGILRATLAGVLLDLCSHGILLVGMKLYERGVGLGSVMAFLIASPWNSLSMTLILWSLVGFPMTLAFVLLSCLIAIVAGLIFNLLVKMGKLPPNPNQFANVEEKSEPLLVWPEGRNSFHRLIKVLWAGVTQSKMILRWIFFGVVLTAVVKELMSPELFKQFFGPDLSGLLMTLVAATVLEVCSEGSAPLAAELINTAGAPGNGFTFLMAGVSTDYTEVMAIKETTKSWKVALFLPLVTLPQVIIIGLILNKVTLL